MKSLIIAALALCVFSVNAEMLETTEKKMDLICLSEDGNVGVEGNLGLGQMTLINGVMSTAYVEDNFMSLVIGDRILGYREPSFTLSAEVSFPVGNKIVYASVTSIGPVYLETKTQFIRATFSAFVSGTVTNGTKLETVPTTLTRCEYTLLDRRYLLNR